MRNTKIVATIGPASESELMIKKLSKAGVNVFRMNFSHGDHAEQGAKMDKIRKLGIPGAILLDTKGPEIRTGKVNDAIHVKKGDKLVLTINEGVYEDTGKLSVNYKEFIKDVKIGDVIVVDSGDILIKAKRKTKTDVHCEVVKGKGKITSKRHINLQGKKVTLPTVTEKDWKDIDFGIKKKVDFIALSFVRTAADIREVRKYCRKKKQDIKIIAKIENFEAVQNLEEIVIESDGVMVARGDLACEITFPKVPQVQRRTMELCSVYNKPVIVATQMLLSMTNNINPTRAEVMDVSTAVVDGADAVMLSDETTKGVDPVNVVTMMKDIIVETEKSIAKEKMFMYSDETVRDHFAQSAVLMADNIDEINGIVVISRDGTLAQTVSNYETTAPIFAFTDNTKIKNQMELLRGVNPFEIKLSNNVETVVKAIKKTFDKIHHLKIKKYVFLYNKDDVPVLEIRKM